jgi:hypothetical protein
VRTGGRFVALLTVVAAILTAVLAVTAGPATAAPSSDRIAIGDSVMLGARSALKERGFSVDATESRQAYKGPALLRQKAGSLPENVIVHLGTNGTFPLGTCKALVRAAGSDRRVFLVNVSVPRSWERSNNAVIRECAGAFPKDRVHVIDWHGLAAQHRGWLYSDRIHLRPAGASGYARMIDAAVDDAEAQARADALAQASGTGHAGLEG